MLRRERRERRREDGRGAAVRDVLEAVGVVVDERRERLLDALGHEADVAARGEVPRRELVPFVGERVRAEAPVAERAEARGAIQHRQVALEARVGRVDVRAGAHDRPPDHDRPSDEGVALHVQRAAHVDVPGRVHGRVRVHVKAVLGLERAAVARDDERAPTRVEGPDQHDVGGDELQARGAAALELPVADDVATRVDVARERADGEPRDGDGVVGAGRAPGLRGNQGPVFPEDGRGAARGRVDVRQLLDGELLEPLDRAALDPRVL